jgi:hypothetical protein
LRRRTEVDLRPLFARGRNASDPFA